MISRAGAATRGTPLAGRVDRLPTQGQRDPERLAGPQGQQQTARLVVGPTDHVHDADADGDGPRDVDQLELLGRDLRSVALAEAEAAEPEPGTAE